MSLGSDYMKKFLKIFSITILSIFLVLAICLAVVLFNFKKVVNKDNISNIASSVDVRKIEVDDGKTVDEYISNYTDNNDLPKKYINTIMESEKVKNLIDEKIGELVDYAVYGKEIPYITSEEIENSINYDEIEEKLDIKLTDADKEKISNYSKDASSKINNSIEKYVVNLDNEKTNDGIKLIRFIFSTEMKIYVIISIVIITFLIFLINWNFAKSLCSLGISFLISGILITGFTLFAGQLFNIAKMVIANKDFINSINKIFGYVKMNFTVTGLVILALGIILIIIYKILKKHLHKEVK